MPLNMGILEWVMHHTLILMFVSDMYHTLACIGTPELFRIQENKNLSWTHVQKLDMTRVT